MTYTLTVPQNWASRPCQFCDNAATVRETSTYADGRRTVLYACDTCKSALDKGLEVSS